MPANDNSTARELWAASLEPLPVEYPLVADGKNFTYRGFEIIAMENSGGKYWTYRPILDAEKDIWRDEDDEEYPADAKMLADAVDVIDAWRDR